MPFVVINGEYVPEAGRPDGDSIRFRPDNPDLVSLLWQRGNPPKINAGNGTIQLRFEGIDTMESRANPDFALAATASNLALCGVPLATDSARGYILSNQLDPHGRPIAFAYSGKSQETDGDKVFLSVERMQQSVNFQQIQHGHAYPLFYDTLFVDLREALAAVTRRSRASRVGVYAQDVTNTGAVYAGFNSLDVMLPLFPKLWRRLDSYSRDPDILDPLSLDEFLQYMQFDKAERVLVIPEARSTGFDNVIAVTENRVSLQVLPENLIFES